MSIGIRESGDLVPEGVHEEFFTVNGRKISVVITPLIALQRAKYGGQAHYTPLDWGVGRQSRGNDRTYRWVVARDPSLFNWQSMMVEWLNNGRSLTQLADGRFKAPPVF